MIVSTLLSLCLAAEQWADEPVPPPEPVKVSSPRVGPVAGLHLGVSRLSTVAPDLGGRVGVRVRLGEHAALSLFGDAELVWIATRAVPPIGPGPVGPPPSVIAQRLLGFTRLELIGPSATPELLVPKLTAGLYFGAGVGLAPTEGPALLLAGGLHLAITRLDPSGWWFPVFFELGLEAPLGAAPAWRFAFGVGI